MLVVKVITLLYFKCMLLATLTLSGIMLARQGHRRSSSVAQGVQSDYERLHYCQICKIKNVGVLSTAQNIVS